jgi:hypothetical protein
MSLRRNEVEKRLQSRLEAAKQAKPSIKAIKSCSQLGKEFDKLIDEEYFEFYSEFGDFYIIDSQPKVLAHLGRDGTVLAFDAKVKEYKLKDLGLSRRDLKGAKAVKESYLEGDAPSEFEQELNADIELEDSDVLESFDEESIEEKFARALFDILGSMGEGTTGAVEALLDQGFDLGDIEAFFNVEYADGAEEPLGEFDEEGFGGDDMDIVTESAKAKKSVTESLKKRIALRKKINEAAKPVKGR